MLQHWTMSSSASSHMNSALRRQLSVTMIVMILGLIPHSVLPSSPPFVKDLPRHQKLILGNVNRWVIKDKTNVTDLTSVRDSESESFICCVWSIIFWWDFEGDLCQVKWDNLMTMTSNVKGDFNRHKSLDGWEVVVRLSKQNLANQRPSSSSSDQSEARRKLHKSDWHLDPEGGSHLGKWWKSNGSR